jgi:TRAP-type mannitol/chloroaromatic compound transport system substrate-binding protein
LSEFVARNNASLRTLIDQHGVSLKELPEAVLKGLADLSDDVMNDLASRDPLSQKVMNSMLAFRKDVSAWTAIAETAVSQARSL